MVVSYRKNIIRYFQKPVIESFETSPKVVFNRSVFTLSWKVENGIFVHINNRIGFVKSEGKIRVASNAKYNSYTLTAISFAGFKRVKVSLRFYHLRSDKLLVDIKDKDREITESSVVLSKNSFITRFKSEKYRISSLKSKFSINHDFKSYNPFRKR